MTNKNSRKSLLHWIYYIKSLKGWLLRFFTRRWRPACASRNSQKSDHYEIYCVKSTQELTFENFYLHLATRVWETSKNCQKSLHYWICYVVLLQSWVLRISARNVATRILETSKNSQEYYVCCVTSLESWLLRISICRWRHAFGRLAKVLKILKIHSTTLCEITLESWLLRICICRWRHAFGRRRLWLVGAGLGHFRI